MPATPAQIEAYKEEIYDQCTDNLDKIYNQDDFDKMHVVPDVNDLMAVANALTSQRYATMLQDATGLGWKFRSREEVKIHQSLNDEEDMVYSLIEESGAEGLWTRHIKLRTKLHDAVVTNVLKSLAKRKVILDHKTVEHPTRKMYIIASVQPNDRATGGAWYTDNELDEELVNQLLDILDRYITKRSWVKPSSRTLKNKTKNIAEIKALRNKAFAADVRIELEPETEEFLQQKKINDATYPFPASYQSYPTLQDCTLFILENQLTHIVMTHEDVQQLLDILCWDGRIEKIAGGPNGVAYKSIRKSNDELRDGAPANGFTEAPCGRCPVFDLCEEGGPVGPSNCEYYTQWLAF